MSCINLVDFEPPFSLMQIALQVMISYFSCRNPLLLDPVASVERLFKPADLEMPVDIIGPPDELDASDTEVVSSPMSSLT